MDLGDQDTTSGCPVCGGSRWWRSRTGQSICAHCYPDAMEALQALADQVNGATTHGERTRDTAIDELSEDTRAQIEAEERDLIERVAYWLPQWRKSRSKTWR